jgi:predicted ABC-type transport system involved in lysophospholipase L1 biosynthesis ATPase subunit
VDEGRTIVMVTHDPDLAVRTRRTVHMVDGEILDGTLLGAAAEVAAPA